MVVNNPHIIRNIRLIEAYVRYCDSHTIYPTNPNDYICKVIPIEHSFESFKENKELIKIWIKK